LWSVGPRAQCGRRLGPSKPADSDTQGAVYDQIISKVILASQNDFEECGVDQTTLDELRQVSDRLAAWLFPSVTAASHARPLFLVWW
jgi:hypothetical protein